jgi:cytochrome c biogenesis protein CcmG/thiol:disulfide interchange protein DsbE
MDQAVSAILLAAMLSAAPDFALKTLDGRTVRLGDYRGKVVLVNFWATWCAGCRIEMPRLAKEYAQNRSKGLEIVGISMDDAGEDVVARFVRLNRIGYAIARGNAAVAAAYGGVRLLPQTFVVGRDGRIVTRIEGTPDERELHDTIRRALALK